MSPEQKDDPWQLVVVDTNVLISAALSPQSVPAQLLQHLLSNSILVFSHATFAELESRLWKPKFDRYLSIETRHALLHDFSAAAYWVEIDPQLAKCSWSRDPDDDHFIRAARQCRAQRLISGDQDLLCLGQIEALKICTPRDALEELSTLIRV